MKPLQQSPAYARKTLYAYVIGFALSIGFTLASFELAQIYIASGRTVFSQQNIALAIVTFGILQLLAQLVCFLHLNPKRDAWNFAVFLFALVVVSFVVGGSLWIMANLNYNMNAMSPAQMDSYMQNQE